MNHSQYIEFHDKFTEENKFEFSYGIYLFRDFVRNRPVKLSILNEFITILKKTECIHLVLDYLLIKNNSSYVTTSAIELIKNKLKK